MKLVKPGKGQLFVSTIAKTPESYFLTILMGEYITRIVPMGTHEWKLYMNHDQVERIL